MGDKLRLFSSLLLDLVLFFDSGLLLSRLLLGDLIVLLFASAPSNNFWCPLGGWPGVKNLAFLLRLIQSLYCFCFLLLLTTIWSSVASSCLFCLFTCLSFGTPCNAELTRSILKPKLHSLAASDTLVEMFESWLCKRFLPSKGLVSLSLAGLLGLLAGGLGVFLGISEISDCCLSYL